MANRVSIRTSIRAELADPATLWSDVQLNRFIDEVTADISRMIPRERLNETTFVRNITAESITSGASAGVAVSLANKPVQVNSVSVTSDPAGTDFVLDTDYQVDYSNGTITHLAAGAIGDGVSLLVTYQRSSIALDISGLTDMILPLRMEWPLSTPQDYVNFYRWGDILYVQTGPAGTSQQNFSDTSHIRLYYYAEHTAPTESADATFPRFLDDIVVKGGVAYALFNKARDRMHQAITDLVSARTALAAAATLQATTEMDSAEVAAAAAKTRADALLDTVAAADITSARTQAGNASTAAATISDTAPDSDLTLARAEAAAAKTDADAIDPTAGATELTNAVVFTTALTAMSQIEAFVGGVADSVTAALKSLRDAGEPLADVETALDKVDDELRVTATDTTDKYLVLGELEINKVTSGDDVAQLFNEYARTKLDMAQVWIQEAQGRAQSAQIIVSEASQWANGAQAFIMEARERFHQLEINISVASQKIQQEILNERAGQVHVTAAAAYNEAASLEIRAEELNNLTAQGHIGAASAYLRAAEASISAEGLNAQAGQVLIGAAQAHAAAAQARINFIQDRISEGQAYLQASQHESEASDRFIIDARDKHTDYWSVLKDRVQKARPHGMVSTRQYVSAFAGSRTLTGDETGPS